MVLDPEHRGVQFHVAVAGAADGVVVVGKGQVMALPARFFLVELVQFLELVLVLLQVCVQHIIAVRFLGAQIIEQVLQLLILPLSMLR